MIAEDAGRSPTARLRSPGLGYSPDFNSIENAFAKLKSFLRKAAARTIDELWNAIPGALPGFTPQECANYFTRTG